MKMHFENNVHFREWLFHRKYEKVSGIDSVIFSICSFEKGKFFSAIIILIFKACKVYNLSHNLMELILNKGLEC